ncbi:ankyrin repeat domain-containing protein [Rhodanobacter sp. DHB23]|uniref:ankyrin repeat domain-containing protein n=1 Tax=Rhodanobacter sp. DHB23 TaxID=2775923 RepID=UPI00177F452B|nr:ankyrin repeat domain-containing protein [Rhodanobacter sp. DHB23]MBD8872825.1 ankyrin repeat domain-containing protein [Rhodanobacter sp. DHB23]
MQEAASTTSSGAQRRIAHACWLAMLALCAPCFAASAGMPPASTACAAGQSECTSGTKPNVVVDADEWKNAGDPRGLMVVIQSNLDRVSAGQPIWPAPKGTVPDVRSQIVDAYADFLHGDFKGMDAAIAKAEQAADEFHPAFPGQKAYDWKTKDAGFHKSFASAIQSQSPLIRLYAALRDVDGSLFDTLGNPFDRNADGMRGGPSPLDGTWVRLPCRTVLGRVPQFVAAADTLKSLGGPVLDCPVDGPVDYAKDEALALHPGQLEPHVTPPTSTNRAVATPGAPAPSPPDSRDAALGEMDTHPQQAAPILEHYSHVDAQGELDYALFLHSFEPPTPARDAAIRALQADLYQKAMAAPGKVDDFPPTPYDGSDDSLLNIIRLASETGITNSSDYDIPCPFLSAHPALIAATQAYYGSNRDNFMPRSGCSDRDYERMGFPAEAVATFEAASTQADGNFIDTFQGTMVYGFEAQQNAVNTSMRIDPRALMQSFPDRSQSFDYPYQVWGYTSLNNYVVSQHLRKLYLAAHDQLAAYYRKHMQLNRADSEQAAKAALFLATFGGNCGGDVPTVSLWRRLLERAPPDEIRQLLGNGAAYAQEISDCSRYAGLDPLLLVAVADPAAFPLVMQHEPDINERNPIGKTALMEAAQFDQAGVAKLLLEHRAAVDATTWGNQDGLNPELGNDARTALMYAAANGSLDLIKALLDAGADPCQADTKGHRAIDYLLGYGPMPPNPRLDGDQRQQAAQWLF